MTYRLLLIVQNHLSSILSLHLLDMFANHVGEGS